MELKKSEIENLEKNAQYVKWDALTIRRKINSIIRSLPDNKDIKRLDNHSNCFIVNFSNIVKNNMILDPGYYDFKYQYKAITKKLRKSNPLECYNKLKEIIKNKQVVLYSGVNKHRIQCYETVKLHPEVIKNLETIG
jgi:hypothetical protein